MSELGERGHPHDIEMERRARKFHHKLAILRAYEGEPPWELVLEAAAASHFLYDAKQRAPQPDFWEPATAFNNLVHLARGGKAEGSTVKIGIEAAQEMIFRASEDPDYFDQLKRFCGYALTPEPVPHTGETAFALHPYLLSWIGKVATGEIRKPKTRKRQVLASEIINLAIANTVQFLKDTGIHVFKNDATYSSINACDAVAEISGDALGRVPIKGDAVKKIYYASVWGKLEKR